jgi:hypothetical protein
VRDDGRPHLRRLVQAAHVDEFAGQPTASQERAVPDEATDVCLDLLEASPDQLPAARARRVSS